MVTPTRKKIIEEATRLYMEDNWNISGNTPEVDELIEEGTYEEARNNLMRSEGNEALDYLKDMANDAGYKLVKKQFDEHVEFYDSIQICDSGKFSIPFDISEQEDSNTLITGANKTGKSRLAMAISSVLLNLNWRVVVFDNVGIWDKIVNFPLQCKVTKNRESKAENVKVAVPRTSTIFDLSLMLPKDQKGFVDSALETVWNQQVENSENYTLVVLEELQLYAKNLRGDCSQNILRISSAGRNHKVRILGVCCDLSLVDPCVIRLCSQRFYGRIYPEENSKRKFRSYHGGDWLRVVSELELGYFVYMLQNEMKVVRVPYFEGNKKPQVLQVRTVTV